VVRYRATLPRLLLVLPFAACILGAQPQAAEPKAPAAPFATAPVRDAELGAVTGREGISQITASDQTSVVSHNTITGQSVTGAVTFDNQAFQNLNGMAVINANTGNNVSINSAFMVNIVIGPRP